MGEKTHLPQGNGVAKPSQDSPDPETPAEGEAVDEIADMTAEELQQFQQLENQLDALNSALDSIEQKNDSIHAELLELLQSNREIRQQLQQSNANGSTEPEK